MGNTLKILAGSLACLILLTACTPSAEKETVSESSGSPQAISTSVRRAQASHDADVPGGTCPAVETIDKSSPDALAQGFISIAMCWDSAYDRSLTAAALRAKNLMAPKLADVQVEPERNSAQGLFNEASSYRAYAVPSAELAPSEVNSIESEQNATRVYRVTWDWVARGGTQQNLPGGSYLLTVHMVKDGDSWQVEDYAMADFHEKRR